MKPIGGYFEWEFPVARNSELHDGAVYLNSGRHALEYILKGIGNIRSLWISYFTCDAVIEPLKRLGISWKFYHINANLEIADTIHLQDGEYLLYTNYYGIKDAYVKQVVKSNGNRVIIDNAQALYCKAIASHQFYSPRKFMGMPDGGLAVTNVPNTAASLPVDSSYDKCTHLLKRHELLPSEGYNDFKAVSRKIAESALSQMSNISRRILASVDLDDIKQKRRQNFERIHQLLASTNRLQIPPLDSFACPLIYPYLSNNGRELKKKLIEQEIFVATYWPNVFEWTNQNDTEYELANHVVCIPIDQRYATEDMERIATAILHNG